jgi:hypothetical protein
MRLSPLLPLALIALSIAATAASAHAQGDQGRVPSARLDFASEGEGCPEAERALIDQALSALRAHHAQNALVALMSHERRFADGALSEERDRLSVDALIQLGRISQARRRAELFEARYPRSAHLQRVRSLVEQPSINRGRRADSMRLPGSALRTESHHQTDGFITLGCESIRSGAARQ